MPTIIICNVKGGGGVEFSKRGFAPLLAALLFFSCVIFIGCRQVGVPKPPGFPKTVPCVITITQDNAPLADAEVHLVPADGATDWRARAVTDTAGIAKINTYSLAEGAPKGKFKVVITRVEEEPSKLKKPDNPNDESAMARWQNQYDHEIRKSYSLVEVSHTSAETTPLELEITGTTEQTFDVGKKVRVLLPR